MPTESSKQEALRRLAYIEGHLKGIRKMVEEDQYCVDVLKQSYAVRCAIEKVETVILRGHLNSCVPEGIREGRESQVIEEIAELFELGQK
jgi:CsoR family transcriptional regulator, copper-sensing transcriptional repressor